MYTLSSRNEHEVLNASPCLLTVQYTRSYIRYTVALPPTTEVVLEENSLDCHCQFPTGPSIAVPRTVGAMLGWTHLTCEDIIVQDAPAIFEAMPQGLLTCHQLHARKARDRTLTFA